MNKFTTIRTSVVFLLMALNISLTVQSQKVYYLPPFELPAGNNNSFQLVGKIDSNYLLYYSRPFNYPEIYCFNSKGELMDIRIMDFIKPGIATDVNMVNLPEHVNTFVQEIRNGTHYTFVASIKPDGSLNGDIRYIDSTRYDQYGNNAFYSLLTSPDNKRTLLYRVINGFSSFQVLFNGILLDETSTIVGSTGFYIPLNVDQEQVGNLFINNEGRLFLPVYDKPNNYRVGTNLRIYQTAFTKEPPKITEIYLKENKPTELILDWHERKNQLVLGGLYYNFYDKRIDGAIAIYMDPATNKTDKIIYIPFEKDFKKELKSRISNTSINEAINSMQTRYINIDESGTLTLLTDMFTNSFSGRKSSADVLSIQTPTEIATRKGLPSNYTNPSQNTRTLSASNNGLSSNSANRLPGADRSVVGGRNRNLINNANIPTTQGFGQRENELLNQPYPYNIFSNAGDIVAMNKTLDYKSVIFTIDSSQTSSWKNWARSLYVPGTPFSNVIIMPQNKSIGLLSYEVNNKNVPFLLCQLFLSADKKINQQVGQTGMPMLFYKKNAVIIDNNSILTLYSDPEQNKLGLAIVKW